MNRKINFVAASYVGQEPLVFSVFLSTRFSALGTDEIVRVARS